MYDTQGDTKGDTKGATVFRDTKGDTKVLRSAPLRTARYPGLIAQPPLHDPGGAPGPRAAQPNSGLEQGPLKSALARRATKHSLHTAKHSLNT